MNLAGKIDTCVFDKTGTLTEEHLILKGVSVYDKKSDKLVLENDLKNEKMIRFDEVSMVLGGC